LKADTLTLSLSHPLLLLLRYEREREEFYGKRKTLLKIYEAASNCK
jgi:hypothetical protein